MHELTNGRYKVVITPAGGGQSSWTWIALSRWSEDPVEDARGFFLYARDLESGEVWSAGLQPTCALPDRYSVHTGEGRHMIEREDHGIVWKTEAAVAAADDLEVRRVTLLNTRDRRRRIELTSYVEVALAHPMGDLGHPAFSKLFVQTEKLGQALLAKRRPRSQGELWPVMFHALVGAEPLASETDRLRFIGRGRSLARPAVLAGGATLSGTVGNVLDPIFSLRTEVVLEPGVPVVLSFLLGVAPDNDAASAAIEKYREVDELFHPVPLTPVQAVELTARWKAGKAADSQAAGEDLRLFNGVGGFSTDGMEYVMRLNWRDGALKLPPMPWINVLANPAFGCLISETGAGCTWSRNSQANRLTPWSNDPVTDPHHEALYVRDEDSGAFWSPMPGPAPAPVSYEVRHGHGYTRFTSHYEGLEQEAAVFVPERDPVKVVRLRLVNASHRPRRLSLFSYQRLVLGSMPPKPGTLKTWREGELLCTENPGAGDFAGAVVFSMLAAEAVDSRHFTCDRVAFLGGQGSAASPAALARPALDGACGEGLDACFAHQAGFALAPGQAWECSLVLGEALKDADRQALAERALETKLDEVAREWRARVDGVQVHTPVPEIDLMVNGWLPYQTLACRVWGRTAFYQSSGAFGFRDQLQDVGNMSLLWPDITRRQILLHAAHQFEEGDVLHWWHETPAERGVRTRFADDLLWLPLVTLHYVETTGDASILEEQAGFLQAEELKPGQEENYFKPDVSQESASLYEHCRRAIVRSLKVGVHGLPLMGTGDWNDGMNRVGREGRGESVWMGFFLCQILEGFIPLARQRGDEALADQCTAQRAGLVKALNGAGWDGEWYRRAYYDDGTPLGTAAATECQIDGLAQSWSVLSGVASAERGTQAMKAAEARLINEDEGLIRLLTPPFVNTPEDPGYIKGYVAGVRENGGQYTHAACWMVMAMAKLGRRDKAARLLAMLSPVWHTRNEAELERYKVEPYVIAADVYGAEPHIGRGGWTWYTGSAGWAWRVAVESVLGLRLRGGDTLILKPCVPDDWPEYEMTYRHPESATSYKIHVRASRGSMEAVQAVSIDGVGGQVVEGAAHVPLVRDGGEHLVMVTMGPLLRPS